MVGSQTSFCHFLGDPAEAEFQPFLRNLQFRMGYPATAEPTDGLRLDRAGTEIVGGPVPARTGRAEWPLP
jgi:hypothetical protein